MNPQGLCYLKHIDYKINVRLSVRKSMAMHPSNVIHYTQTHINILTL